MNKLRTARVLMIATMVVIVAFQAYWIRKLFAEEKENFKKSTDIIFKESMYRLQAERFAGDSTMMYRALPADNLFMKDVMSTVQKVQVLKDSSTAPRVMISMSTNSEMRGFAGDSGIARIKSDTTLFVNGKEKGKPIAIERLLRHNQTLNDTIPVKRIDSLYTAMLAKEGINVSYNIVRIDPTITKDSGMKQFTIRIDEPAKAFTTKRVPVGFLSPTFYRAEFATPTMFLMKKISLPILLSVLMIALTTLSFIFIYRNLVAQKRLTAIKNEFIGNITHELKTPISTVSVAIEAMKNFNALQSPERTQEYLGIASLELNRLSLLVDKVLRLSMFETQQVELKYEWFDLKELVEEVIASMQLQFEKHGADVKLHSQSDDFSISIMADRMHITSVVYNLLDNALKYSKEKPQIDIGIEAKANQIILQVKDNGIGIPASYKDKVFDKFFRVPHGDKHNIKGYGLGLSYVAHIIAQHKGTVNIESEEGKGTTFIIKLPKENAGS
jgi:two-component system phosphate regulon sensor histidine kinase PhoR